MTLCLADQWTDYELLDCGDGERLERWGDILLRRPDPQVIWPRIHNLSDWEQPHARYHRSASGGGEWEFHKKIPEHWTVQYKDLRFKIKPTSFKHTGLFPEQAVNWDWMTSVLSGASQPPQLLNLFAYTGAASVVAAAAGAKVCHVDASKGMVKWAKENLALSGLGDKPVRFLSDDAMKFVLREHRREHLYDAIVMDPPSYGRGAGGEAWKLETSLFPLLTACHDILSPQPIFVQINSYTTGLSATVLGNLLALALKERQGYIETGEIALPVTGSEIVLPSGIFARWLPGQKKETSSS